MGRFFALFVLSGFCGLVYQVVWLRLAMAAFGVTTALVSIVLSVFMAGLAGGSFGAGKLTRRLEGAPASKFLRLYAATELWIGLSGVAVPPLLSWGRAVVAGAGEGASWGSGGYYAASAAWVVLATLPFCIGMGATFPLAMAAIRRAYPDASSRSFSYLYVANVLGAMAGSLGSAFVLIETLGFRGTLLVAAAANGVVAIAAWVIAARLPAAAAPPVGRRTAGARPAPGLAPLPNALTVLVATGVVSLAMEVVWTRQFVPFQGPVVYAFATILAAYLAATIAGSRFYRHRAASGRVSDGEVGSVLLVAFLAALLPLALADPRLPLAYGLGWGSLRVVLGVGPFCAALGYLTPMVLDRYSGGDPERAGGAYALNTLGCIAGPAVSGFLLLPRMSERATLVVLALPLLVLALAALARSGRLRVAARPAALVVGSIAAAIALIGGTRGFETLYPSALVRRDHTATVIATGEGLNKQLLVNGQGITTLTPVTKEMAHLPLAHLDREPKSALVLCLGMGTSFRSALAWGIPGTVVELVPSVPGLLPYFHPDGAEILGSPRARIVVDDARRFLERTRERFDVIVIDPPPPVEAAASSLLYTVEFYDAARRRLAAGGILQQWLPEGETVVIASVAKALSGVFPYVRVFRSVEKWGFHFLASDRPIPRLTAADLVERMPPAARFDLVEWGPSPNAWGQLQTILETEMPLQAIVNLSPRARPLEDDRPVNEYYFLRRLLRPRKETQILR